MSRPAQLKFPQALRLLADSPQPLAAGASAVAGHYAGCQLASHFQPIFSLSHGRVVGHEALLRATDAGGQPLPPPRFFDVGAVEDVGFEELLWRDRLVRTLHAANYVRAMPPAQWLFLNQHPQVFLRAPQRTHDDFQTQFFAHFGLRGPQVVIEVLEDAVREDADFDAAIELTRSRGCLIALDDFGAGHSNFDRVWRLRPEIVKLDRSLVERAARDLRARRVVVQMVSLLHECGALVLMEGIENEAEAFVALEADVDMVQGYFFGRPQAALVPSDHASAQLNALWSGFAGHWRNDQQIYREHMAPYISAIEQAAAMLAAGRTAPEAAADFLRLADAEVCYLIGEDGRQIGSNQWTERRNATAHAAFEPFHDTRGARWGRRPYFRRAVADVGRVQVTRPYRTLHGGHLCVTVSTAFRSAPSAGGKLQVVCGDLNWN